MQGGSRFVVQTNGLSWQQVRVLHVCTLFIDDCLAIHHNVKSALTEIDKYFLMKPGSIGDPDMYLHQRSGFFKFCTLLISGAQFGFLILNCTDILIWERIIRGCDYLVFFPHFWCLFWCSNFKLHFRTNLGVDFGSLNNFLNILNIVPKWNLRHLQNIHWPSLFIYLPIFLRVLFILFLKWSIKHPWHDMSTFITIYCC